MPLYAAYGSNLDPARMASRAPASPPIGWGWLRGWRLTFGCRDVGWTGALTTMVEDPGHDVFVMLYDMAAVDEAALDIWEGVDLGLWHKIRVRVDTSDGDILAWAYVLDDYEGGLPSAAYRRVIADAAHAGGAPRSYVERIAAHPCQEDLNAD